MRAQVIKDTTDDFQEVNHSLGKFDFLFVLQDDSGGLGSHLDLLGSQLCSAGNGSGAKWTRRRSSEVQVSLRSLQQVWLVV